MQLISQNPYHVIGVTAGASQRAITKQKSKINALRNVGRDIKFDDDFDCMGIPKRSKEELDKAFSSIEIDSNKVKHALFWFVNCNHLDDTALEYLKGGDKAKAEDIWSKVISGKNINNRNYSAFANLATIKLYDGIQNGSVNAAVLKRGIRLKADLLTSDYLQKFAHFVSDETYSVEPEKELNKFVDSILDEYSDERIIQTIASAHPALEKLIAEQLTADPLHSIQDQINRTKKARKKSPRHGITYANNLYKATKNDLSKLSNYLDKSDLKYQSIADKLAFELLQCGIVTFNELIQKEEEYDCTAAAFYQNGTPNSNQGTLGSDIVALISTVEEIAVGTRINDRIQSNKKTIQDWIDNAPQRRKRMVVSSELDFIEQKLEKYQNGRFTVKAAEELIDKCKPKLQKIKHELGKYDDFYIKISTAVVGLAQSILVESVNRIKPNDVGIYELKGIIELALEVSREMDDMAMVPEMRAKYESDHETLESIARNLGIFFTSTSSTTSKPRSGTGPTRSRGSDNSAAGCIFAVIVIMILFALCS